MTRELLETLDLSVGASPLSRSSSRVKSCPVPEGPAHHPSTLVVALGKGRLGTTRRVAVLERKAGSVWREVGRFGSLKEADRALDEAVANGERPDSLRVAETRVASNGLLWSPG
jgi:hypothetical protein